MRQWQSGAVTAWFTQESNWLPTGIPDALDTAAFTNVPIGHQTFYWAQDTLTDSARFSSSSTSDRLLDMGSGGAPAWSWTVTNRFDIAPEPGNSDKIKVQPNGDLRVTNAAGTALLTVANGGYFRVEGHCMVDRIVSTNSTLGVTSANPNGELRILHGSHIVSPSGHITLGSTAFLGGSHRIEPASSVYSILIQGGSSRADGPGTVVTNTQGLTVGQATSDLQFVVTNGASFHNGGSVSLGSLNYHRAKLIVTGPGSRLSIDGGYLYVGPKTTTSSNELLVVDGALVDAPVTSLQFGRHATSLDNRGLATGNGTEVRVRSVYVGPNATTAGTGSLRIEKGATLDTQYLISGTGAVGSAGDIVNEGGIYQFPTITPVITTNAPGKIILRNGTIAFRNTDIATVRHVDSQVANIAFEGANGFRLNCATNSATSARPQGYVFDTGLGADHYARLELVNGATRYRGVSGDTLAIGSGGSMLVSNTAAAVDLPFTNDGTLSIAAGTLAFSQPAALNGTLEVGLSSLAGGGAVVTAGNLALGAASVLALQGDCTNDVVTLCAYTGTRTGVFGMVTGIPWNMDLRYGPAEGGTIELVRRRGSMLLVR